MAEAEAAEGAVETGEAAAPAEPSGWTDGLSEDAQGYVENKGWDSADQLLSSYRSLEKTTGAPPDQIMRIPQEADDAEGWSDVYSKLGRPKTADAYELDVPDLPEGSVDMTSDMRNWAHEAGLSQRQAETIYEKYNSRIVELTDDLATQREEQAHEEEQELRREWGDSWDENIQAGVRFRQRFGVNDETINKLESALGLRGLLELTSKIGKGLGEHGLPSDQAADGGQQFSYSPAGAQAKIDELMGDTSFTERYMAGDKASLARITRLHAMAHPDVAKLG